MQKKSLGIRLRIPLLPPAVLAVFLAGGVLSAFGQAPVTNIALLADDGLATTSFTGATNWSDGLAPFSGNGAFTNAYFTTNFVLRTPADGNSYIFAGDSLSIDPYSTNITSTSSNVGTGTLSMKGYGVITVSNLLLNGGKVVNNGTGGSPDTAVLAGNINVTANSVLDGGVTAGVTALNIMAPMIGNGGISIQDNGTVLFSTNNTYIGNTGVSTNSTLKMGAANAIPNGAGYGFLTLSGGTPSGAVLDLNGFDTTVNDLTSGGGTIPAKVINSAPGKTNTLTVDCEFVTGKTWKGYISDAAGGKLALTVIGSTFWTVATNLTYSGDTTINGGRLLMGNSTVLPWGPGKGNIIVNSNGILDLQGRSPQMNGIAGNGTIDNLAGNGPGAGGHSTLNCGSNDVSSTFSGVIQNRYYDASISANNDYVQLTKFGAGTLTLTGTNTYNGNVNIHAGVLRITYQNGDGVTGGGLGLGSQTTPPTKLVNIDSSTGDAGLHFLGTNGPITVDSTLAFQTAGTNGAIVNEAGNNAINGTISLRTGGGTTIRVDADTLTLAGNINILTNVASRTLTLSGAANGTASGIISDGSSANNPNTNLLSLTKSGAGSWTLEGANTYSDVTTISAGTLLLGASGSIGISSAINVQTNGTFNVANVTGGWALGAGQSLKGSGTVVGSVTANGKVSPGDALIAAPIATLTFANHLTLAGTAFMEVNRTNTPANADLISAAAVTFGGTLTVTNAGDPLQAEDTFKLFNGALDGQFTTTNLPSLSSSSLFWDTSLLASQGIIRVASNLPPTPTIQPVTVTGTNLNLKFSSTAGFNYYVESTPSLVSPITWAPRHTNSGGGVINLQIPIDPAKTKEFFRVRASAP